MTINDMKAYFAQYDQLRLIVKGRYSLQPKDNDYFRLKAQLDSRLNLLKVLREKEPFGADILYRVLMCQNTSQLRIAKETHYSGHTISRRQIKALKIAEALLNDPKARIKYHLAKYERSVVHE